MEIKRISPEEAKELLESDEGYIYLDVRTVPEFDAGHVPGAKNVPVMGRDPYGRMQVNSQFVEIVEANFGKDAKCITDCEKGGRSMKAVELLLSAGFTNVVDMGGGYGAETDIDGTDDLPGLGAPWTSHGNGERSQRVLRKLGEEDGLSEFLFIAFLKEDAERCASQTVRA